MAFYSFGMTCVVRYCYILLFVVSGLTIRQLNAQGLGQNKSKLIRKIQKTTWQGGISMTAIDDDGKAFKDFLKVGDSWNYLYFPSKLEFEGYRLNGFTIGGTFTYSKLQKGKPIGSNNEPRPNNVRLFSLDMFGKLYPRELKGELKNPSEYVIAGFGITYRTLSGSQIAFTANLGFGLNYWLSRDFGLNIQSIAKFAVNSAASKNYLQHSLGVIYRFNVTRGIPLPNWQARRYNLFRAD
jgi:hypothetical protein